MKIFYQVTFQFFRYLKILLISLWLLPLQAEPGRTHKYQVKIDDALTRASVSICFAGKAPEYLAVDYRKATKKLTKFPRSTGGTIEFQGRYWMTKNLAADACIEYESDISEHNHVAGNSQWFRDHQEKHAAISFQSDNSWLWLPEKLADDERVEIRFNMSPNYSVSAPWKKLDTSGVHYSIGKTPHDWGFTMVIGEFQLQSIELDQRTSINIAILNQLKQQSALTDWISDTAQSLTSYLGKFPVEQLQVILIENTRFKNSPVPWGDVKRGGGFGIRLVVDSSRPIQEFYQDWTVTHEFAHLLLPSLERQDLWMTEGLPSYLQYLLMAQSGRLTEQQAWQKLYAGFMRGFASTEDKPAESLLTATKNRGRGAAGRTKRIYWSGAVYFLQADIQLRQQTRGKQNLAMLLLKLNQCCADNPQEWSGKQLAVKLDQLSATDIFSTSYTQFAQAKQFPDFVSILAELGIEIKAGQVQFNEHPNSQLRQQIFAPK